MYDRMGYGPWRHGRYMGRRSSGVTYVLALLGLVGFAGMHRFYLGRPMTGLLWLVTGGLCGVGTLMDLLFMPGLLRDANEEREL